jgi:purine-nucleoside phosphorylase
VADAVLGTLKVGRLKVKSSQLNVGAALEAVQPLFPTPPSVAIVLGSGLGGFVHELKTPRTIETAKIPGYPASTVAGHSGMIHAGRLDDKQLLCFQGRIHLYEGYSVEAVTFPIRLAAALGAKILVLTNAVGGIHPDLQPGSFMLIEDQINLQMRPMIREAGTEKALDGEREPFLPEGTPYWRQFTVPALQAAAEGGISLLPGVLGATLGPSYETPAEIRMLKTLGADVAGMSTVCEAVVGARLGMKVLGLSCITNRAAGLARRPLNHTEVLQVADKVKEQFIGLLKGILSRI